MDGLTQIDSGMYAELMKQVGNGNPIASGASYGGFVILWFAAFISEIGAQNKLSSVNKGMGLSTLFIFYNIFLLMSNFFLFFSLQLYYILFTPMLHIEFE